MGAFVEIRLSPSRVEKWIECPARWGFAELEGNPEPGTEATELGTAVHGLRETYYLKGTPFDLTTRTGFIAAAMSPLLPHVLPVDGRVEHELSYQATPAVRLVGRLDLCYPSAEYHPNKVFRLRVPGSDYAYVRDYKTTGSMAYAKLERDALFGHSQAPLYALMYMNELDVQRARCGWVYVGTRGSLGPPPWPEPELKPSDHWISKDEATERVHMRMVPAALEMLAARDAFAAGMPVDDLPKNQTACWKYNRRCPYFARCQPEKQAMSTSAFLAAVEKQANAATPPAAPPAEAPPVERPYTEEHAQKVLQQYADNAAKHGETPPAVNPPESANPGDAKRGGKGKKNQPAGEVVLNEATIAALADAIVQRLGLRLVSTLTEPSK